MVIRNLGFGGFGEYEKKRKELFWGPKPENPTRPWLSSDLWKVSLEPGKMLTPTVLYTLDLTFPPCLYLLITLILPFSRPLLPWKSSIYTSLGSCTHLSLYFCALSQNTVLKLLITQLHMHNMNLRIMIKTMEL